MAGLRNIHTERPNKRSDARHAKYTITAKIRFYAVRLDTPAGVYNIFYAALLGPVHIDPFPSQQNTNYHPLAELVNPNRNQEYGIDHILDEQERTAGQSMCKEYLVKGTGYREPT